MGYNLFNSNAQKFIYYSMALENSGDVVDTAQYVFIQGIDESFAIAEELSTSQFEEHWNWKRIVFKCWQNTRTSRFEMRRIGDESMRGKIFGLMGRIKSNRWASRYRFARSRRSGDSCCFAAWTRSDGVRRMTDARNAAASRSESGIGKGKKGCGFSGSCVDFSTRTYLLTQVAISQMI